MFPSSRKTFISFSIDFFVLFTIKLLVKMPNCGTCQPSAMQNCRTTLPRQEYEKASRSRQGPLP
jgi:hypothetical protein